LKISPQVKLQMKSLEKQEKTLAGDGCPKVFGILAFFAVLNYYEDLFASLPVLNSLGDFGGKNFAFH
jgi:hypothetical protein